ncbi:hypothetical protein [Sphingomonas endolithica]|uniref:hypothetical protein n=1 Tax=Sphingomonas endolithica TaxID=2972485 RepID=UPI0021AFDEC9|nr:hypothetical protein [Sphingomonas sp. ZFBP2030]
MIDEDSDLWADGVAYMEAYGDQWPDQAIAHAKRLVAERRQEALPRWLGVVEVMKALHHRGTEH